MFSVVSTILELEYIFIIHDMHHMWALGTKSVGLFCSSEFPSGSLFTSNLSKTSGSCIGDTKLDLGDRECL